MCVCAAGGECTYLLKFLASLPRLQFGRTSPCRAGRREFAELLLKHGANPTLQLGGGQLAAEMVDTDRALATLLMEAAEGWVDHFSDAPDQVGARHKAYSPI